MSKDMLGPIIRALVGAPVSRLGVVLDIANRLHGSRGEEWDARFKVVLREGLAAPVSQTVFERNEHEHLIDGDASPYVPDGWKVEEHKKGGQIKFDAAQVELFLAEGQQGGKVLEGNKLRKELADKRVLNANVLDYLLANPHLIPEGWKGKAIFFWGTIYRDSDGYLHVRCLGWLGGRWRWRYNWLDFDWLDSHPAVLSAS